MKYLFSFLLLASIAYSSQAQNLSYQLEELTAPDFIQAVEKSSRTCIIPIGVMEKHGAHLPLGTDLYLAREYATRAAEQDYTVVFPEYYFSQINEARQQPGTISYSPELIWKMLQETLDELNRNGFDKIIIVNGHGGNNAFLNYFGMAQLSEPRDYALYWFRPEGNAELMKKFVEMTHEDENDSHAGTRETSTMLASEPDVVHVERAGQQSGEDLNRINQLKFAYTGIWWYASFPNHYGGEASKANTEAGELLVSETVKQLVEMIKTVKADKVVPELQKQFFEDAENPLKTKQ